MAKTVVSMVYKTGNGRAELAVKQSGDIFVATMGGIEIGEDFKTAQEAVAYAMEAAENYQEEE